MKRYLALAVAALLPASARSQATPAQRTAVDAIFAEYTSTGPGCAVGVARDGAVTLAAGYGLADVEHRIPITPSTPFYIASTSKQVTAFAIVLLARDGRLSLDDDIRRWVPEVSDFGETITIRHLLHHTSGLRDYFDLLGGRGWAFDDLLTEEEFLRLVSRQRDLNFPPGRLHQYSNTGYVLLSIVVNRARGQSLRQFASERIFTPLGMTRSVFRDDHRMLVPDRALAYEMIPGNALRHSMPNFDVVGDGGLFSSVEDLVKWASNAYTPRAGDAADLRTMLQRGVLTTGDTIPYALGLVHDRHGGRDVLAHGGAFGGYRAELLRIPSEKLDVAILCNSAGANPSLLARRVADVFVRPVSDNREVNLVRRQLEPGERVPIGTWVSQWNERWFRIEREGDSLVATGPFARTAVNLVPAGAFIPSQRLTIRSRGLPAAEWEASLGGAGWESLRSAAGPLPTQGAISATMGDWIAPESDGRLTLIVESGQLTLRRAGAPPTRLAPLGPGRFVAGPVVVTMLGGVPYDSLHLSTPRASRVKYVRASR